MSATEPSPGVGDVVAGYRLEEIVGGGGMGTVYRATHERLGRQTAVKILRRELSSAEYRERFEGEARIAARLDHPNVLPLIDFGEHDGLLYLVMPFVVGHDLRTLLTRVQALDPRQTIAILRQVAAGLDAAHAHGLVHRDVKPANILVAAADPRTKTATAYVTDFGVAKDLSAEGKQTTPGTFVGTRHYASPEQIDGRQIDGRADQYALACVAYECLTGRPPYDQDSDSGLMFAHLLEAPPSARAVLANLPSAVDDVLAKAMAKSPGDRFPSCTGMVGALDAALAAPGQQAPPVTPPSAPSGIDETGLQLGPASPGAPSRGHTELLTRARERAAALSATPPTSPLPAATPTAEPEAPARVERRRLRVQLPSLRARGARVGAAAVFAVAGAALLIAGALARGGDEQTQVTSVAGPRPARDSVELRGRQRFAIQTKTLLGNDRGSNLRIVGVAGGPDLHGRIALNKARTTLTYVADRGFSGPARFTYTVRDRNGRLGVGTVALRVTSFSRAEQQLLAFVPSNVVASCVSRGKPAGALAAVRCRSALGTLEFARYPTRRATNAAFRRSFRAREGDCARGPATGTWHWPRSSADVGRFGCKRAAGAVVFGWTLGSARYAASLTAPRRVGLARLNRWFFETARLKR